MLEGLAFAQPSGDSCPGYQELIVTPPNETHAFHLRRHIDGICQPQIHPAVAGSTGTEFD
jgi:hypothetical protein